MGIETFKYTGHLTLLETQLLGNKAEITLADNGHDMKLLHSITIQETQMTLSQA